MDCDSTVFLTLRLGRNKEHILIVDDVFTTGSTLYECYKAVREHFDGRISVATLAVVER